MPKVQLEFTDKDMSPQDWEALRRLEDVAGSRNSCTVLIGDAQVLTFCVPHGTKIQACNIERHYERHHQYRYEGVGLTDTVVSVPALRFTVDIVYELHKPVRWKPVRPVNSTRIEAEFHRRIKTFPFMTKRYQGYVMGAFREAIGVELEGEET